MLWYALHLPLLSLEAFCAADEAADGGVALLEAQRIGAVDAAAAGAGVRPGMKRATALALLPGLRLGQADARRDARALQAVAHAALAFTPSVTLEGPPGRPDTVLLEVQASLRLFGGAESLLQRLQAALQPLGHRVRVAAAPTALGAALLARWREGFAEGRHLEGAAPAQLAALQALLGELPLGLLASADGQLQALQGMGLHRLADLRALPRDGLARRFGQALLDELDRACGTRPDPRRWVELPARFETRLELQARADHVEQLLPAAAWLLARLAAWAQGRQSRVAAYTLHMLHEPRHRDDPGTPAVTLLRVELAEPAADAAQLQMLLRERLGRCRLPAPTLELRLVCRELQRRAPPNQELFPTRQSEQEGLARLLERLRARLGDAQVQRLEAKADHRPERSVVLHALAAAPMVEGPAGRGLPGPPDRNGHASAMDPLPLARPAWLLPEPQPLAEQGQQPQLDGSPLRLLSGPERIESGWWDGALVVRDYFIAAAADQSLVWIYRSRLGTGADGAHWFLQGRFG